MLYLATDQLSIVRVGPHQVPGIVQSIELPERGIVWQVQQGVAGIGAHTIWRGVKLIESVKIKTLLAKRSAPHGPEWDEAAAAWMQFLRSIDPAPLVRSPPAWDVDNPLFRMLWPPLARCAHKSNVPTPANDKGLAWIGVLELIEYKKLKLAPAGPPEPAQIDSREVPPRDAAEANRAAGLDRARQVRESLQ
jgi:hypothetical protein